MKQASVELPPTPVSKTDKAESAAAAAAPVQLAPAPTKQVSVLSSTSNSISVRCLGYEQIWHTKIITANPCGTNQWSSEVTLVVN